MLTPERLRETVEQSRGIMITYAWTRKRYQKDNGIADWPEEECWPTPPTPEELAERRRIVEYILGTLLVGEADEGTKKSLEDYACGGDSCVGIVLRDILNECGSSYNPSLV